MAKWQALMDKLTDIGAIIIEETDGVLEELDEILDDGWNALIDLCAFLVTFTDRSLDILEWAAFKTLVIVLRAIHRIRTGLIKYRKEVIKDALFFLLSGICVVACFSAAIDYEYAYNGRVLGIVREQKDVIEILETISEELTQEYGSDIDINPNTDIVFTPVVSAGKEIDDVDTVLRKFTYMGDIKTTAYAIYIDGVKLGIVESEKVKDEIIEDVINQYMTGDDSDYESIGIYEDVTIEQVSTLLSRISNKSTLLSRIENGHDVTYTYEAGEGDTIEDIVDALDTTYKELKASNEGVKKTMEIEAGHVFQITKHEPLINVKTVGKETFAEVIKYETQYIDTDEFYETEEFTRQEGKNGKQRVTAMVTRKNGEIVDREDLDITIITPATTEIIVRGTKERPPLQGTGTFIVPVPGSVSYGYGMRWGRMHYGLDYPNSTGTPIKACDGGTVTYAGILYSYGYVVEIDHGKNFTTRYAHCSQILVNEGDQVFQGQTIALVGNTGRSYGAHLHLEVMINGTNVDPALYVGTQYYSE